MRFAAERRVFLSALRRTGESSGRINAVDRRLTTLVQHEPCRGCPHHRQEGAGCAIVEVRAIEALDGFLGREPCYLKDWLRAFVERYQLHRPRSSLAPDDLMQDVATRLLSDPNVRRGGFGFGLPAFLAYLRQTAVRCAISGERREHGRIRCGNCSHYTPYSGRCINDREPHARKEIPATQDPRQLSPPCRGFELKRHTRELLPETEPSLDSSLDAPDPEFVGRVLDALAALAEEHPRAALVVRARLFDAKTYDQLAHIGASVRTMKRDYAFGLSFLRERLSGFVDPDLAPLDESSRSGDASSSP